MTAEPDNKITHAVVDGVKYVYDASEQFDCNDCVATDNPVLCDKLPDATCNAIVYGRWKKVEAT